MLLYELITVFGKMAETVRASDFCGVDLSNRQLTGHSEKLHIVDKYFCKTLYGFRPLTEQPWASIYTSSHVRLFHSRLLVMAKTGKETEIQA